MPPNQPQPPESDLTRKFTEDRRTRRTTRSEDPLARARRHVTEAEQHVEEQRARVDELIARGDNTKEARMLLASFKKTLRTTRAQLALDKRRVRKK